MAGLPSTLDLPCPFESLLLCGRENELLVYFVATVFLFVDACQNGWVPPPAHLLNTAAPAILPLTIIQVHALSWVLVTKVHCAGPYHGTLCRSLSWNTVQSAPACWVTNTRSPPLVLQVSACSQRCHSWCVHSCSCDLCLPWGFSTTDSLMALKPLPVSSYSHLRTVHKF